MSKNKLTLEIVDELKKSISDSFVTYPLQKNLLKELEIEVNKLDSDLQTTFSSFKQNIDSIASIVMLPYRMAIVRAINLIHDEIFQKERIKITTENYIKENIKGEPVPTNEEELKKCREITSEKLAKFAKTEDFHIQVQFYSVDFIKSLIGEGDSDDFLNPSKELINQASLLSWCALEILARDVFVSFLNKNPNYVEKLYQESSLRNKFDLKSISTEKLIDKNFDLSSSMGDLLIENFDFSNLEVIRSIYTTLFNSKDLNDNLGDYLIWQLFQRRNLIVHRGGKVDAKYNSKTEDDIPVGTKLFITPEELNNYLSKVIEIGLVLIKETTAHNSG